jgi:magnesium-transporting ATPase (P-type)
VLHRCSRAHLEVHRQATEGARVLALAYRDIEPGREKLQNGDVESDLELLGLVGMIDPPREAAVKAVSACQEAGIKVKMITGDHAVTARAIGRAIGLCDDGTVLTGSELVKLDDAALSMQVESVNVFARVAPEHKLRLVKALQGRGEITAMTGDGVKDAPALRQADVGIAMGISGTAAAREASDIVLADDNFATIVAAVEEGRRVFDNLLKGLAFILATNLGQVTLVLIPVLTFPIVNGVPLLPISPLQILWVNLVVAVGLALPLAVEAGEPDAMQRRPRPTNAPILGRDLVIQSGIVAILMAIGGISLFLLHHASELERGTEPELARRAAQTVAVTTVILMLCFYLLESRSFTRSIFSRSPGSNPWIYVGAGGVLLLQLGFVYLPIFHTLFDSAPLNLTAWLRSVFAAAIVIPAIEVYKALRRRRAA